MFVSTWKPRRTLEYSTSDQTRGVGNHGHIYTLYLIEVELPTYRSYVDTLEDYLFNYAFYHKS